MNYIISGKNIEVTDALKQAIYEKLERIEKFFGEDTAAQVTLSVDKDRQKIEVTIPMKGHTIRAEQASDNMYVSIDLVVEIIERQVTRHKKRILDKEQNSGYINNDFFDVEGLEDEDVQIIADPEQLKRVINNIVGNSVKYLDKQKGFINIRIKDVGDFIQVEIEDNGRGIAARDLPYIFDRFYRADASRNSATGGSGIGLSIVRKIIEDHGGKIWATSKESIGTVMYFVLRKYQEVPYEQSIDH